MGSLMKSETAGSEALLEGVTITELRQFNDARGSVLHMRRCDDADFSQFGECYFSEVLPKAVKAWKRHRVQSQHFAVPVGRIRLAIYDDRQHSLTKGQVQILELGRPDAFFRLRLPPGLWYGFTCISEGPALLANCTDYPHDPTEGEQRPTTAPEIPYHW
jgi:dTDP-4-dehydrorhamnose 3,5-epimerase